MADEVSGLAQNDEEKDNVASAQRNLRRLMAYATGEARVDIPEALFGDFVKLTSVTVDELLASVELKVLLWRTLDRFAQLVQPATIEGIQLVVELNEHRTGLLDRSGQSRKSAVVGQIDSKVCAAVSWSRRWVSGTALVAVLCALYTSWGLWTKSEIEHLRKEIDQVDAQIASLVLANPMLKGRNRSDEPVQMGGQQFDLLTERLSYLRNIRYDAQFDALHHWYLLPTRPDILFGLAEKQDQDLFDRAAETKRKAEKLEKQNDRLAKADADALRDDAKDLERQAYHFRTLTEINAYARLTALSIHVLPVMFGLLGACVFVVRDLNDRIRDATLSRRILTRIPIRRLLGMILGGIVGLLFPPDVIVGVTGLSLVSVAFFVGYSVETTVGLMQALVDNLSQLLRGRPDGDASARARAAPPN